MDILLTWWDTKTQNTIAKKADNTVHCRVLVVCPCYCMPDWELWPTTTGQNCKRVLHYIPVVWGKKSNFKIQGMVSAECITSFHCKVKKKIHKSNHYKLQTVCVSILMPDYCTFIVNLKIRKWKFFNFGFFQNCSGYSHSFAFPCKF